MKRICKAFVALAAAICAARAEEGQSTGPRARLDACGDVKVVAVQDVHGYNSWPMMQAVGGRLVCAYSRGSAHTIGEGVRGVYSRTSTDGGATWLPEVCVVNDPNLGEVTIGKGLDDDGAMLLWVRNWGRLKRHDLYRTMDGIRYERIASPKLSPMPIQVTDIFKVPGVGLMSLWFAGNYKSDTGNSWGTLTSADNGRTWVQHTVEDGLSKPDWPTEQSAVYIGDGRILAIARSEGDGKCQFQLTSTDYGKSWLKRRTNITDVKESTPSLVYSQADGLVANYYYHRGARKLKRRTARVADVFDRPVAWPEPEVLAEGYEARAYDAGNVNATVGNDGRHHLATYSGSESDTTVFVVSVEGGRRGTARTAGVVAFKDAAKIKSWDAWDDHKKLAPKKEKRCVTWERLCKLDSGLEPFGMLETRPAKDIAGSQWSIGCETMDRDYADWDQFKAYVGMIGAKRGRLFSGWAKTEQEKGKYDFTWLDPQVREMAAMGVKPWICLSYGNPVYGSDFRLGMRVKQVTGKPEAFGAWIRYCKACVEQYKDVVDEWEIWNEPFWQGEEYAEMFYRTAKAIREVQPSAKIFCTAVGFSKDYKCVLERLKKENALGLATRFIYHPYDPNPDESYEKLAEPLRRLVKSYSPDYDILQGEVGCPSQLEYAHALSAREWTEYSQAKWDLRRTIGDAVRNIPCSVFTMIDLQYTFMLQSFGMLRSNLLKEVVYRRPSFYAMQHVFSFFDDESHPVSVKKQQVNGKELTVATFENRGGTVYVLWFSGERPGDTLAYERATVQIKGCSVGKPVWVDLLTGKIGKIPGANVSYADGMLTLKDLPLWDSPIMVAGNELVPRRTVWEEMSPEDIVDAIYRPKCGLLPRADRKVFLNRKMDVSTEPWTKMATTNFLPCFDRYGQFKYREWPGKTHSDTELQAAAEAEERDLAAYPGPTDRDRFGGWSAGPRQESTGRFRTAKIDGKWWLVDPDGNLFWSWGAVRVTPSSAVTPLNGNPRSSRCGGPLPDRDCLFEGLPAKGDPFAAFYDTYDALLLPFYLKRGETRRYDFSAANLYRKYGKEWFAKFSDSCHRRLRSWGANTIANSSDLRICLQDRTPYAERIECQSRPIEGSWGHWFKFRDPFDPSFTEGVKKALVEHGREAHDPWCIGFFIDNEIGWGSKHEDLARWTLRSPDGQPAKTAFLKRLAAKGIAFDNNDISSVPGAELRAFTDVLVEEYFKRTRETVKAFDKDLLYLGCRFAGRARDWVIGPCAKYSDVISYNIYADQIADWRLPNGLDAPVLIGEFHFGAHDRGLFGSGLINTGSQEGRAAALKRYVESALANPQIVGVHWHQFSDQPTAGRFDGEHFQVGWTDVCDRPYPETIQAIREVGYPMYETRCKAQ